MFWMASVLLSLLAFTLQYQNNYLEKPIFLLLLQLSVIPKTAPFTILLDNVHKNQDDGKLDHQDAIGSFHWRRLHQTSLLRSAVTSNDVERRVHYRKRRWPKSSGRHWKTWRNCDRTTPWWPWNRRTSRRCCRCPTRSSPDWRSSGHRWLKKSDRLRANNECTVKYPVLLQRLPVPIGGTLQKTGGLPKALAMAICSRMAMSGIRPTADPISDKMSPKDSSMLVPFSPIRFAVKCGSWKEGRPGSMSPESLTQDRILREPLLNWLRNQVWNFHIYF